ncbi:GNAT family N-acetyltransferase [Lapillicoccus jejuensis]|uniref:Acetyltransferase (GNAT) family protein n=1 Tax=Lapillicoccus jejuensis TaxID=402171 RepID=A0A542DZY9_9MICO|nr:GNAT family N-acetyltransferase [Lapillicoccus jejuensis]TQJ08609.1 acetyltransferase (GNAT) family protein [Lapillicoccus jejuensis]
MTDLDDDRGVLAHLESYYDAAPRGNADTEEVGPFTLFVSRGGWPYYARPRLTGGDPLPTDEAAVRAVLERQRELGVPRALEWVHDVTPDLLAAARAAGLRVEECPLLVLDGTPTAPSLPDGATVRLVEPDDPDLPLVRASIDVGFGHGGTATGEAGEQARDEAAGRDPVSVRRVADGIRSGRSLLAGAWVEGVGPVAGGSHNPRPTPYGDTSEVVGLAVLPAYRRRGLAGVLAARLAQDALGRGVGTVFLSAQDDAVARVYASVGFRRVATACVAEGD